MKPLSKAEFDALLKKDQYYAGRWPYLYVAGTLGMRKPPTSVLEIGPYRRALFAGSKLMDRRDRLAAGKVDFVMDAGKTPWPIPDSSFDLFVGLQVWEHLAGAQARAFGEVRRVARRAVLSFPYLWSLPDTGNCHHGVDDAMISKWTQGIKPVRKIVVQQPDPRYKRMVCLFEF